MLTIEYNVQNMPVKVKAIIESDASGDAKVTITSVSIIGLDLFGLLKSKVVDELYIALTSRGLECTKDGSTLLVKFDDTTVIG